MPNNQWIKYVLLRILNITHISSTFPTLNEFGPTTQVSPTIWKIEKRYEELEKVRNESCEKNSFSQSRIKKPELEDEL